MRDGDFVGPAEADCRGTPRKLPSSGTESPDSVEAFRPADDDRAGGYEDRFEEPLMTLSLLGIPASDARTVDMCRPVQD